MCKPSDTPKVNAEEWPSTKEMTPPRMAIDADFARMLERQSAMWQRAAEILADALTKETDCDADESCECAGCKALVQYEKTKRSAAGSNDRTERQPPGTAAACNNDAQETKTV